MGALVWSIDKAEGMEDETGGAINVCVVGGPMYRGRGLVDVYVSKEGET